MKVSRLPKNVTCYADRHGKVRYRFRRNGSPQYLFVEPYPSPAFDEALARCRSAAHGKPYRVTKVDRDPVIYFIGSQDGPVKIGLSSDPAKRLRDLQTGSARTLMILATVSGSKDVETFYHRRFASARMAGEWFEKTPEIAREIAFLNTPDG